MTRKRICALVTGATGFIGSRLVRRLVAEEFDVHAVVRPDGDLRPLLSASRQVRIVEHDGSTDHLIRTFAQTRPDLVFHLAACFRAEHRSDQVTELVDANVRFGAQLLEAMAVNGTRRLVNTGTSWQHFESSAYRPACLYAATKQAFEAILDFYVDAHCFQIITLKLFDTYGPGDARTKLLPSLQSAARSGVALDLTAGEQLMDLVYIDDVVEAFLIAGRRLSLYAAPVREEYAITSGSALSVRQLVTLYSSIAGANLDVNWGARPYRSREVMIPWRSGQPLPGWSPRVPLEQGIRYIEGLDLPAEVS